MSQIVSNSSPLIVLAKAGLLDLLPKLFSEIVIPQAVRLEIESGPKEDPMRAAHLAAPWRKSGRLDCTFPRKSSKK